MLGESIQPKMGQANIGSTGADKRLNETDQFSFDHNWTVRYVCAMLDFENILFDFRGTGTLANREESKQWATAILYVESVMFILGT